MKKIFPMKKKKTSPQPLAEEWDFSKGFGILPSDIPLTQNIGCVGKPKKKEENCSEKKK
jgi:hypothetical protein